VVTWVIAFPALVAAGLVLAALCSSTAGVLLVASGAAALLLAQTVRIALKRQAPGESAGDAALYGAACMAGKVPQLIGMLRHRGERRKGQGPRLIEYK
jgi:hypothetical protein